MMRKITVFSIPQDIDAARRFSTIFPGSGSLSPSAVHVRETERVCEGSFANDITLWAGLEDCPSGCGMQFSPGLERPILEYRMCRPCNMTAECFPSDVWGRVN